MSVPMTDAPSNLSAKSLDLLAILPLIQGFKILHGPESYSSMSVKVRPYKALLPTSSSSNVYNLLWRSLVYASHSPLHKTYLNIRSNRCQKQFLTQQQRHNMMTIATVNNYSVVLIIVDGGQTSYPWLYSAPHQPSPNTQHPLSRYDTSGH